MPNGELQQFCVARLRSADQVLAGEDIAPHLSEALAQTLINDQEL